jgi:hypothetical protein
MSIPVRLFKESPVSLNLASLYIPIFFSQPIQAPFAFHSFPYTDASALLTSYLLVSIVLYPSPPESGFLYKAIPTSVLLLRRD